MSMVSGHAQSFILAEVIRVETPKTPLKKQTKKAFRKKKHAKLQSRAKYQRFKKNKKDNQQQANDRDWNGLLTLTIIGLLFILGTSASIAYLFYLGVALFANPFIIALVALLGVLIYLTFVIVTPIVGTLGIMDLDQVNNSDTGLGVAIAIISILYLVLVGIACLVISPLGLIALVIQAGLMLPGIIGLVLSIMGIQKNNYSQNPPERKNNYDGYDY
jgi:hypothetical protein